MQGNVAIYEHLRMRRWLYDIVIMSLTTKHDLVRRHYVVRAMDNGLYACSRGRPIKHGFGQTSPDNGNIVCAKPHGDLSCFVRTDKESEEYSYTNVPAPTRPSCPCVQDSRPSTSILSEHSRQLSPVFAIFLIVIGKVLVHS